MARRLTRVYVRYYRGQHQALYVDYGIKNKYSLTREDLWGCESTTAAIAFAAIVPTFLSKLWAPAVARSAWTIIGRLCPMGRVVRTISSYILLLCVAWAATDATPAN